MPLPTPPLPADSLVIGGQEVGYHALTRAQALKLNDYQGQPDEAEDFMLSCALDLPAAEVRAWREAVDWDTAGALVDAVIAISGLEEQPTNVARGVTVSEDDGDGPKG